MLSWQLTEVSWSTSKLDITTSQRPTQSFSYPCPSMFLFIPYTNALWGKWCSGRMCHRWDAVAQHNGALLKLGRLVTAQWGSHTHRLAEVTSFSGHLFPSCMPIPLDITERNSSIIRSLLTPWTFLWLCVRKQHSSANTKKKYMSNMHKI